MNTNPNAYSNGEMACKYGFPRDSCRRPAAERAEWQRGWDAENERREKRATMRVRG